MAITTFIPTIWEARLLAHLDKALIYGNLCNRDYEGDISQAGDTVIINQIGDIAIKDYKKTEDITLDDVDGTPTQLKIDQSIVRDVLTDPNDAAIARTVVALANSLGLSVIAEGLETEEQRAFLARNHCHSWQGYLLSKPIPAADFEQLVRDYNQG